MHRLDADAVVVLDAESMQIIESTRKGRAPTGLHGNGGISDQADFHRFLLPMADGGRGDHREEEGCDDGWSSHWLCSVWSRFATVALGFLFLASFFPLGFGLLSSLAGLRDSAAPTWPTS